MFTRMTLRPSVARRRLAAGCRAGAAAGVAAPDRTSDRFAGQCAGEPGRRHGRRRQRAAARARRAGDHDGRRQGHDHLRARMSRQHGREPAVHRARGGGMHGGESAAAGRGHALRRSRRTAGRELRRERRSRRPGRQSGNRRRGFPRGKVVDGTIQTTGDAPNQAQKDAAKAYADLASQQCNVRLIGQDLGGQTLTPGVYCFPAAAATLTGELVLDAQGDPNAVFVFQVGTTLTTAARSSVRVTNSGQDATTALSRRMRARHATRSATCTGRSAIRSPSAGTATSSAPSSRRTASAWRPTPPSTAARWREPAT